MQLNLQELRGIDQSIFHGDSRWQMQLIHHCQVQQKVERPVRVEIQNYLPLRLEKVTTTPAQ